MKRNFNYTGRTRIEHLGQNPEVVIQLFVDVANDEYEFTAALNLDKSNLPPDSPIVIEAIKNTAYERFPWGTIQAPRDGATKEKIRNVLHENLEFRVKIVDQATNGKLLARSGLISPMVVRENIPADHQEHKEGHKSSMFIVIETAMAPLWRLETKTGKKPVLYLNRNLKVKNRLLRDALLQASILPAVHRELATRYLATNGFKDDETFGPIVKAYLAQFVEEQMPEGYDLGLDDRAAYNWVEAIVSSYTTRMKFADHITPYEDIK